MALASRQREILAQLQPPPPAPAEVAEEQGGSERQEESKGPGGFEGWLDERARAVEGLREDVAGVVGYIEKVKAIQRDVEDKQRNMKESCAELLREREDLLRQADRIAQGLSMFKDARKLALLFSVGKFSKGIGDVEEFVKVLRRIDDCSTFVQHYPHFAESKTYAAKFDHLRDLALLRTQRYLEFALESAHAPTTEGQRTPTDILLDLRAHCSMMAPLLFFIQEKAASSPQYKEVVLACQHAFYEHRHAPVYRAAATYMIAAKSEEELASGTRSMCLYLIQVVCTEHHIFYDFFSHADPVSPPRAITDHLQSLSSLFYGILRPRIIQETNLDQLCDMSYTLSHDILDVQLRPRGEAVQSLEDTVTRVLQDVQERLVYVANVFIRDEIDGFSPTPEDVAYPALLTGGAEEIQLRKGWYPTVDRTLSAISKLYPCLEQHVFGYVAQDAMLACLRSLVSVRIENEDGHTHTLLFLLRQLFLLEEQMVHFGVDIGVQDTVLEFSSLRTTFSDLIAGRASLFRLLQVATPTVKHTEINSMGSLHALVQQTGESFVLHATTARIGPLIAFVEKKTASPEETQLLCDTVLHTLEADTTRATVHAYLDRNTTQCEPILEAIHSSCQQAIDSFSAHTRGSLDTSSLVAANQRILEPE